MFCWYSISNSYSQTMYVNYGHFDAQNRNMAIRSANEIIYGQTTTEYNNNMHKVNENVGKILVAKNVIYNSLVNVNNALRDGRQAKYIVKMLQDISTESNNILKLSQQYPQYVPLASKSISMATRLTVDIYTYLADIVLSSNGENLLNSYKRQILIDKISTRVNLLFGTLLIIKRSIERGASLGLLYSYNPFRLWINRDRLIVEDIIRQANYL